jgi:hypothetical protein
MTDVLFGLSEQDVCNFSRAEWHPKRDFEGFVAVLFEIIVGHPPTDESGIPSEVPLFVSDLIEAGLSGESRRLFSFGNILEILKSHDFKIVPGVDSAEVFAFVDWIEEFEQSRE